MSAKSIEEQLPTGFIDMERPRPFRWKTFVYWRRSTYLLVSFLTLLVCVLLPILNVSGSHSDFRYSMKSGSQEMIYWAYLILGAGIVSAFVQISIQASKLFDDCKNLAKRGIAEAANVLWVIRSRDSLMITYRYWDDEGREHQRDASAPLSLFTNTDPPVAGDMLPVLFDPKKPGQINLLWLEIAQFVEQDAKAIRANQYQKN